MNRDSRVQLLAFLVLCAGLVASLMLSVRLSASAARHRLVYSTKAAEGQPKEVALGIAMGAFRGIFVNILWMRANDLKEAGRYHESVELAKAITTLQPRFPRAWSFHAWNLAYNISVTTQTPLERWNWVNQGVALLRDKGIKVNPNDLLLHKELGWIFLHKIQGITDDANIFYKKMHAKEWQVVLGTPPRYDPSIRDKKEATKRFSDWLLPIVESPGALDALYVGPGGDKVRALVDAIRTADIPDDFDYNFLRRYEMDRALTKSIRRAIIEAQFGPRHKAFRALIDDPAYLEAWPRLLACVRARVLRDVYNMDPAIMLRFTQKYGPLDWRNPAAHGLYWSALGVENAQGRQEERHQRDYDFVNTDRVVIQSVQELYRTGTIYFDYLSMESTGDCAYLATIEPNFADCYGEILDELRERSAVDQLWARGFSFYSAGYENFLRDVIRYFYRRGDLKLAEKYRSYLLTWEGQNVAGPDRINELSVPLDDFVKKELWDRQTSPSVAISEVDGALQGAYDALRAGDTERFRVQVDYAKNFFDYYQKEQIRKNPLVPNDPRTSVLSMNFSEHAGQVFALQLQTWAIEDSQVAYSFAPVELRRWGYLVLQSVKDAMTAEEGKGGTKFADAFPEPEGWEPFRKIIEERIARERARGANELK
jgi:hypothetical protein